MKPLVSQLWPQFMADPDFASCFGRVIVEHARMIRQEQQVIFTRCSAARLVRVCANGCWLRWRRIMKALICGSKTCLAIPVWTRQRCAA